MQLSVVVYYNVSVIYYSAIIGRNMDLFKKHLIKFVYAMPVVCNCYILQFFNRLDIH